MDTTRLALIGAPSCAGARRPGLDLGPGALRAAGLVASLEERGFGVTDLGDVPGVGFRPDPEHPRAQNAPLVARVARDVGSRVEEALRRGALPVVLGGDCSITLGALNGLLAEGSSLGLLYLDGDLDLNTPETTRSGFFDGMVTAHLLGRGHAELAHLGARHPLLEEPHLVYFGYNEGAEGIDPPELALLERSAALRYPLGEIRADPATAARTALAALEGRVDRILVHFDLDVTDEPAVDVPHPNGLSLDAAASVLEVFLASPKLAGLVVTELNPLLDPEGSVASRLAACLSATLAAARRPRQSAPSG